MLMQLATLAGALFVGLVAIALVFLLGMRAKSPLVLSPLIRLQRAILNPRQMRSAGTPGAYAAVIRHRGRISGRPYETPVGAVAAGDGFVIALPYGSRANWLQNVLASGSATIVHEGQTYPVDQPEVVPMQAVEAQFTAGDQRSFRWFAVDRHSGSGGSSREGRRAVYRRATRRRLRWRLGARRTPGCASRRARHVR
jgi:deazaflavin-dependent oxidoreductase (nitroreductase family)